MNSVRSHISIMCWWKGTPCWEVQLGLVDALLCTVHRLQTPPLQWLTSMTDSNGNHAVEMWISFLKETFPRSNNKVADGSCIECWLHHSAWQIQDATPCSMPGIYVLQALLQHTASAHENDEEECKRVCKRPGTRLALRWTPQGPS